MGASQRRKGAAGENELAGILSDELGRVVKRKLGQARDSGDDIQVGRFRIEAKRRARIALLKWLAQCELAAGPGDIPVVAFREDRGPWCVMLPLQDFLPLMRGELGEEQEP